MGLMDKVKSAADKAVTEAKKGTAQIKEKVGDAQLRRKADDAAKRLGYLIVKERVEGVPAGEEADKLVEEIKALEAQIAEEAANASDAEASTGAPAAEPAASEAPGSPPESPAGDPKVE